MTNKWDDAAETMGKWGDVSLLIDTDTAFVGSFERALCAACTGVVDDSSSDACIEGKNYNGPDLTDVVGGRYDDHGDFRPAERYRDVPDGEFTTVRIRLNEEPSDDVITGIAARALAFAKRGTPVHANGFSFHPPFAILGFRMLRERTVAQTRPV